MSLQQNGKLQRRSVRQFYLFWCRAGIWSGRNSGGSDHRAWMSKLDEYFSFSAAALVWIFLTPSSNILQLVFQYNVFRESYCSILDDSGVKKSQFSRVPSSNFNYYRHNYYSIEKQHFHQQNYKHNNKHPNHHHDYLLHIVHNQNHHHNFNQPQLQHNCHYHNNINQPNWVSRKLETGKKEMDVLYSISVFLNQYWKQLVLDI